MVNTLSQSVMDLGTIVSAAGF